MAPPPQAQIHFPQAPFLRSSLVCEADVMVRPRGVAAGRNWRSCRVYKAVSSAEASYPISSVTPSAQLPARGVDEGRAGF